MFSPLAAFWPSVPAFTVAGVTVQYGAPVPGAVQSVERAASLLKLLAGSGALRVSELSEALRLPKSTVHGLLRTLCSTGLVEQDDATRRYRLLLEPLRPPQRLDVHELRSRAMNWADSLAAHAGEAVHLAVLTPDRQVSVIHHVFRPDDTAQTLETGAVWPAHATALGKVLLAGVEGQILLPDDRERFTPTTLVDATVLRRELFAVGRRGWALEREECLNGVAGLAVPVHGPLGRVVAALGLRGPVRRLLDSGAPRAHLLRLLLDAASATAREVAGAR